MVAGDSAAFNRILSNWRNSRSLERILEPQKPPAVFDHVAAAGEGGRGPLRSDALAGMLIGDVGGGLPLGFRRHGPHPLGDLVVHSEKLLNLGLLNGAAACATRQQATGPNSGGQDGTFHMAIVAVGQPGWMGRGLSPTNLSLRGCTILLPLEDILVKALLTVVLLLATFGCSKKAEVSQTIDPATLQMFAPLPSEVPPPSGSLSGQQIDLGRMLYYETRLSADQKISCNTCHGLDTYGVDGEPTSDGHKGQKGSRNSPTVYNAAGHVAQFWDGRAPTVEEQAKGPVMNPVEMAMPSEKVVVAVLKSMPEYVQAFKAAFPTEKDPVTFNNMARAIGAFERRLLTPSRWDKFLQGDAAALTPAEKEGIQYVHQRRLSNLPRRRAGRRRDVPEARGDQAVSGRVRRGPLPADQERRRQDGLQSSVSAQYREDRDRISTTARLERWLRQSSGWRNTRLARS